jgi:thioredoxin-dependent peroxiredoxin
VKLDFLKPDLPKLAQQRHCNTSRPSKSEYPLLSGAPDKTRNTPMIDPPKATKGRHMSKESRKKSSTPTHPAKPDARPRAKSASDARPTTARSVAASKPTAKRAKLPSAATGSGGSAKDRPVPGAGIKEGDKAPAFTLPRDGGGSVSLSEFAGQNLVLFFYPKANTPGCTRESIDFSRLAKDFAASGTAVLGVSADSIKAQDSFRDKHQLAVPLLSDADHGMLEAYGAWGEKSLYGRKFLGIIRSTVLIGKDGRIARIWRNVKVDGHADAVLAIVQTL